jgi:acyl-CoA thioester hydrolase
MNESLESSQDPAPQSRSSPKELNEGVKGAFRASFPIRISDINYGGHMGNDRFLSLFHDARLQFLKSLGLSERDIGGGTSLIMSEAHIRFRAEAFYGDSLTVLVTVSDLKDTRFVLEYAVSKDGGETPVATGYTVMVGFDYERRRVCRLPKSFRTKVT